MVFLKRAFALSVIAWSGGVLAQEPTIRSTAVVDLSFDEADGAAEDRAAAGAAKDAAQPVNAPVRVKSPFWNVRSGQALRLDATKAQFAQVADSPDLDHQAGTTLSFFYLNLHEPTDGAFHGIVAKRSPAEQKTNYGFNYQPSSGRLQVYIHDGSGFKTVGFPIAEAFGIRRLNHLTATFRPGDAPEPDADGDPDDLEIRLYVNGRAIKPMDATGGPVLADAGWISDVNFAGLLSDTPLTIGSSAAGLEPVSALLDELLVFNRPLSTDEAAKLFLEVAGSDAERLASLESQAAPTSTPTVTDVSPRGLQIGATTRLVITGTNLGPEATVSLFGLRVASAVAPESTPERLVVDVTVPPETLPTVLPFAVRTKSGISSPRPLPVDRLPQRMVSDVVAGQPAPLPAALTGQLNDADRLRFAFDGHAGDTFVAETELKRLGGAADPVLELKTETGTPIEIAWGRTQYGGDARLVASLPTDGRYVLELHDIAYQAPASPFRLLAGNLRLLDGVIPTAIGLSGSRPATAVGIGIDGESIELHGDAGEAAASLAGPAVTVAQGPLPVVPSSDGRELSETEAQSGAIDVAGNGLVAAYVTGRLVEQDESDRFLLRVQPGQPLELRVETKRFNSSVEPLLTVVERGNVVARQAAQPGSSMAALNVTPHSTDGTIEVQVADRLRGTDPNRLYRLRIAPAGTPECRILVLDSSVTLPTSGRGVMRLRVERSGNAGAVTLIPDEASGVVADPATLPAGAPSEEVFVTLAAVPGRAPGGFLAMTAEIETPNGPLRRPVRFTPGPAVERFDSERPYFRVPLVTTASAPSIELTSVPATVFKGIDDTIQAKLSGPISMDYAVRLSLVSDEPARPLDPNNVAAGNKPRVDLPDGSTVPSGMTDVAIPLAIPGDIAVAEIRAVVKAEVVPHAYSDRVSTVGFSAPLRLTVKDPIAAVEPAGPTILKAGENRQVKIAVRRDEGFGGAVRVELRGLPAGFAAPAIDLPADQTEATFTVTAPAGAAPGLVPNVALAVTSSKGVMLKTLTPFGIEVQP